MRRRRSRRCSFKGEFGGHLSLMLSQRARRTLQKISLGILFLARYRGRQQDGKLFLTCSCMLYGGLPCFCTDIDCEYLGTILQTRSQALLNAENNGS
jgi:hypothetical protein